MITKGRTNLGELELSCILIAVRVCESIHVLKLIELYTQNKTK